MQCKIISRDLRGIWVEQIFLGVHSFTHTVHHVQYLKKARKINAAHIPIVIKQHNNKVMLRIPIASTETDDVCLKRITTENYDIFSAQLYTIGKKLDQLCGFSEYGYMSPMTCMSVHINEKKSVWVMDLSHAVSTIYPHSLCSYQICRMYTGDKMVIRQIKIACVVHIGNIDIFVKYIIPYLKVLATFSSRYDICFYCTVLSSISIEQASSFMEESVDVHFFPVENRGMDIGGFLYILKYWKKEGLSFDYIFKFHTKSNKHWRETMCNSICSSIKKVKEIVWIMKNVPKIGLIGSQEYLMNIDFLNDKIQKQYCKRLHWSLESLSRSKFIGGTIFCIRFSCIEHILNSDILPNIFNEFEEGYVINSKETNTHAWERLLGVSVRVAKLDYLGI